MLYQVTYMYMYRVVYKCPNEISVLVMFSVRISLGLTNVHLLNLKTTCLWLTLVTTLPTKITKTINLK